MVEGGSRFTLSKAVLNAKFTTGVFPFDRTIDTGDLTRAAFQTSCELNDHFPLLVERIEVCRTGINAESFFAEMADFLVKGDVCFFIVLKGV